MLLFGNTVVDCQRDIDQACFFLKELGFVIILKKRNLVCSLKCRYLELCRESFKKTGRSFQD